MKSPRKADAQSRNSEETILEQCLNSVDRIVVWSGRVGDKGVSRDRWRRMFIVDLVVVGADGGEIGLWCGSSYDEALAAARRASRDFGDLAIIDKVRQ